MAVDVSCLPEADALVRLRAPDGSAQLALWRGSTLWDLSAAAEPRMRTLDRILALPLSEALALLERLDLANMGPLDPASMDWLAPVETQEVWASGVTYRQSREARMEEAAVKDIYARVYEAERPELFFKAAGWRVVPPGGRVGVRSDSDWDVPEPELAVLTNAYGEVFAYACGNDVSSRSIEGLNPLYLPQAKVYDASCSIGPVAVLASHVDVSQAAIRMIIERAGQHVFAGETNVANMVRDPAELARYVHCGYTLPVGAWLLTGTGIVPPLPYTAEPGDRVTISIDGLGELHNVVSVVDCGRARAAPRQDAASRRDDRSGE